MYFDSLASLLAMEGHGVYVWSAYFIAVTVVMTLLLAPGRRRRRFLYRLSGELRRQAPGPTRVGEET